MRKKNNSGRITHPDFKLYCKVIVIKAVWYWQKNRDTDEQKQNKSQEINPHIYRQLIYEKEARNI